MCILKQYEVEYTNFSREGIQQIKMAVNKNKLISLLNDPNTLVKKVKLIRNSRKNINNIYD